MNDLKFEFPITIYGKLEPYNQVLSKARCRIFYKYGNRNGTYISDDFAEELIKSLPYTPAKGIFKQEDNDYTDHGQERNEGRIYGIVPENPHITWEDHQDEDGKIRKYACCDVLIFTAIYEEARDIVGKSLSMELFDKSLEYHWGYYEGQKYLVFEHGCFLGLQVLGDKVEPCFEGAAFYSLQQIDSLLQKIKEYTNGGRNMEKLNFKLSDDEKFNAIWVLLNPEYNEEGKWTVSYNIDKIYDDYALCLNYETGNFERVYYTKNEDLVEITHKDIVYIMDLNEKEKETVEVLRKLNGDTYELVSDNLINAEKNAEKCKEFGSKIEDYEKAISTLKVEAEGKEAKIATIEEEKANIKAEYDKAKEENEELKNYKLKNERKEKEDILSQYEGKLKQDVLNKYEDKIDNYSLVELDKELAYELKQSNFDLFNGKVVPKVTSQSSLERILSQYSKE